MKAAVIEKPNTLVVRDVPEPEMGEYEARCELLYGATCAGTDGHLIAGDPPFRDWVKLPAILGHESIGRVEAVGPRVRTYRPGDLITRVGCPPVGGLHAAWGGFAEIGIAKDWRAMRADGLSREEWNGARVNHVLPPGTDPAAATLIITWRETFSYVTRMGFRAGASLAVMGSGGNGLAFLAHARHLGLAPRVMIGAAGRREQAAQAGATAFVDYRAGNAVAQAAAVCPDGFDFVIDAVGKAALADKGLSLLTPGGSIGIYGLDDAGQIRLNPNAARGTFTVNRRHYDEEESHEAVVALFQAGELDPRIWLDREHPYPLDAIRDAFDAVRRREVVKALVRLRG